MADSPGSDDTKEYLFLDKDFLDLMKPGPPKADLQNALKEINKCLSEQLQINEKTKSQYKTLKEKCKTISEENEKLKMDISSVKEEICEKDKELEELNSRESKDLYKYECLLYRTITKIKWDLDCPENEIAGIIGGKTITTFQLDKDKHSKTFIANHLWNLIGNAE